jgi:aspartyl-tRNA synthetase
LKTASESGAEVFRVDYFSHNAFLAQSPQFYKQMAIASGFERIFETGPVFRAEKSHSRKHATEFSGLDVEFAFVDSCSEVMELEQNMVIYAMQGVKEKFGEEIKKVFAIDFIVPQTSFPVVDLQDLYNDLATMYGYKVDEQEKGDLTTEGEKLCAKYSLEKFGNEFLFVTGFSKDKRAFYHMRNNNGTTKSYDLIWKGCEITTGAQREHRFEILQQQAKEKGLEEDVKFYLEFFKYGCPPHGGFGIGIDRITMLIFNMSIKESMFIFRGPDRLCP